MLQVVDVLRVLEPRGVPMSAATFRDLDKQTHGFNCEACGMRIEHYVTIDEHGEPEDCKTAEGGWCEQLIQTGAQAVWIHVELDERGTRSRAARRYRSIFARGGWICAECVARYTPKKRRAKR